MIGNVLTPLSIWGDFRIESTPIAQNLSEEIIDGIVVNRFFVSGRTAKDGQVNIFVTSAKPKKAENLSAILILPDFKNGIDQDLLMKIANHGYYAIAIDLAGKEDNKENFTVYPESLSYANYSIAENMLFSVKTDVIDTCWFEWGSATKYVLEYVKNLPFVKNVSGLGIASAGTVLWHVSANEKAFASVTFLFNAGWEAYKDKYKTQTEQQNPSDMSDEMLKYLAGIEPEAYAPYVSCPIYLISATNSDKFECDRAADTLARVKSKVYTALDYSVNHVDYIEEEAFENVLSFLDGTLADKPKNFPQYPDVECDIEDGQLMIYAKSYGKAKKLTLFASEQTEKPSIRAWLAVAKAKPDSDGNAKFSYIPYRETDKVFFFVKAEYDNHFTLSSAIVKKEFNAKEIKNTYRANVIFSGRDDILSTTFVALEKQGTPIDLNGSVKAVLKKGPMDITGVYSESGLITYKINSKRDKPNSDSILVLDVYAKEETEFKISLVADMHAENQTEYSFVTKLNGGEVWHNLKIELSRFKSAEGRLLKSYETVNAIKISMATEYLINNLLWV